MRFACILLGLFCYNFISAQCNHTPTIETEGDFILCPMEVSQIFTQEYDSYQWFKKSFSGTDWEIIPGETSQFLDVVQGVDDLFYFNVAAILNGCSETSSEVLIDSWVFAGIVVESTGNYIYEDNLFKVCLGDSITFSIGQPYNTNIQWHKDGVPIEGENGISITLTDQEESGVYFVEGAPGECPDYIVNPGVDLPVLIYDCNLNINDVFYDSKITLYPNPANEKVTISNSSNTTLETAIIYDLNGKLVSQINLQDMQSDRVIDISCYATGVYMVNITGEQSSVIKRMIKE
ncbi:MAG: hypothetical protein ACI93N_000198 [Flavobacteriaceae bacterium]|jgi:hypothetical protein